LVALDDARVGLKLECALRRPAFKISNEGTVRARGAPVHDPHKGVRGGQPNLARLNAGRVFGAIHRLGMQATCPRVPYREKSGKVATRAAVVILRWEAWCTHYNTAAHACGCSYDEGSQDTPPAAGDRWMTHGVPGESAASSADPSREGNQSAAGRLGRDLGALDVHPVWCRALLWCGAQTFSPLRCSSSTCSCCCCSPTPSCALSAAGNCGITAPIRPASRLRPPASDCACPPPRRSALPGCMSVELSSHEVTSVQTPCR
jgi:hypothetical protein